MDFRPLLSQGTRGMEKAVILCDGYFGQSTGKTANGLVRYSKRYEIAGVIDHTKAGRDAGDVLDGKPNGVPIVANLKEAIERCQPETLIIGVATFGGYIPRSEERRVGKSVVGCVDLGGRRIIKKKKKKEKKKKGKNNCHIQKQIETN